MKVFFCWEWKRNFWLKSNLNSKVWSPRGECKVCTRFLTGRWIYSFNFHRSAPLMENEIKSKWNFSIRNSTLPLSHTKTWKRKHSRSWCFEIKLEAEFEHFRTICCALNLQEKSKTAESFGINLVTFLAEKYYTTLKIYGIKLHFT